MRYDYKAKTKNIDQLNNYMLAKTVSMFEYEGLPDTIPYFELEKIVQKNGYAFITEVDGKLYALAGTLGGVIDVYGNPSKITVANVALNLTKMYDVATEGVLFRNDDLRCGLLPMFDKANTFLAENDINMMVWGYNSRIQKLISAPDDKTKESAETYIKKIVDGELSVIGENALFDGVRMPASNNTGGITVQSMVEFQQYIKASMYNEIGISANFNMKRERLVSGEVDQSEDSLFPFVYNMMKCRLKAVEAINEKYGLNIAVDFGSVWSIKNKQLVDDVIDKEDLPDETKQNGSDNVNTPIPDGTVETDQDEQRERERGQVPETESESESKSEQVTELQAIIDNPDSTDDDILAATELLAEINK